MTSRTDRTGGEIDWPVELERTPAGERSRTHKFSVTFTQAIDDIERELVDRLGVDDWRLSTDAPHRKKDGRPYAKSNPDDPGVAVRWSMDGAQYAVAADQHTDWRDNAREIGLWLHEKRKMADRPVATAESEFATARLPPGDGEEPVVATAAGPASFDPHDVLEVSGSAPDEIVEAAAKRLARMYHPDSGEQPDREKFIRVQKAKVAILDE